MLISFIFYFYTIASIWMGEGGKNLEKKEKKEKGKPHVHRLIKSFLFAMTLFFRFVREKRERRKKVQRKGEGERGSEISLVPYHTSQLSSYNFVSVSRGKKRKKKKESHREGGGGGGGGGVGVF